MNLPNKLTVSRFALTVLFLWAIFSRSSYNDTLALFLFCMAGVTDLLDGRVARQRNLITNFGVLMDPLADKIMTCSAFIALVERHAITPPPFSFLGPLPIHPKVEAWMVVVIVARELAITGLRLLAASKSVVLAAERYGKHKTISQIVAIIALLVMEAYMEWPAGLQHALDWWVPVFAQFALWVTVTLTATSGALYLWRNRALYLSDV
jgi:CDP-diacylglycerol---glycerol-3-phosphate 3-phosphatidyltransferase